MLSLTPRDVVVSVFILRHEYGVSGRRAAPLITLVNLRRGAVCGAGFSAKVSHRHAHFRRADKIAREGSVEKRGVTSVMSLRGSN